MTNPDLEFISVSILPDESLDPAEQARNFHSLACEAAAEIMHARAHCLKINQVDNNPAKVIGLKLSGKTFASTIEVTYSTDNGSVTRVYSKYNFYQL
ncbi:hypothetical protein GOV12_03830 [Candidatus Pacearchaeota archaeon]|nr:hypothetical protein [Candidatus Pacearchaeota archaeon]